MKRLGINRNTYFYLIIFLCLVFFTHFIFRAFSYSENYLIQYDPKYWEERYYASQWVVPDSKNSIGDDGLYAYAGYKYAYEGYNPILINAEFPPLGKYLIGYTILIFGNQNVFGLFTGILALALFFILNTNLFKSKIISFLPVFIFSLDKLFWEQLQANYLDLLYLSFLMLAFIFALKRNYIFVSLALGAFASTKFPPTSILLALCILIYVFFKVRKDIYKLLASFILWPLVFVLSYWRFFMLGNNIIDFLKVMKYFLNFYTTGAKTQNNFMVLEMIFLGRWPTWWTGTIRVEEWNLLWPISTIMTIFSFKFWKKIISEPIFIILVWIILYTIFLLAVPVAPRYLLLLIPFLYNVAVWILFENTKLKSWFRLQ